MCRGNPINLVEIDARRQRMLTASGDLVKVWALKDHKLLKELRLGLSTQLRCMLSQHVFLP